jgi:sulfoxide reductase heme-binding subunit YedZ
LGSLDELTANPIEFITRSTGTWALVFLCLTLCISPLKQWLELPWLVLHRRTLGLLSFFYACLHFLIWFYLDHLLDIQAMFKDVYKRPFITMGFISFLLLWPLALTSNQASIRWLRQRWAQLHRLIYLIAITVILHYWWHKSGKHDYSTVSIYALVIASLLGLRVYSWVQHRIRN